MRYRVLEKLRKAVGVNTKDIMLPGNKHRVRKFQAGVLYKKTVRQKKKVKRQSNNNERSTNSELPDFTHSDSNYICWASGVARRCSRGGV